MTASAATPLERAVRIPPRFHRSIHLVDDWDRGAGPGSYLVTGAIREIAGTLLDEVRRPQGTRAWTLTGPYGAGKSAFLLFLADLLSNRTPTHPEARRLRGERFPDGPVLQPVLLQAEPAPLAPLLSLALRGAGPAPETGRECAELLTAAAEASPEGLLVVVDELGKYLEHAAGGKSEDIFLLQQLAEAAARSPKPVVLVGALHSGFADYLGADLAAARRAEWQKVQGRFRDLPFALPTDQALDLLAQAVAVPDAELRDRFCHQAAIVCRSLGDGCPAWRRATVEACAPLHPTTALLLWPVFRSKAAQNERSLFAFLTSHEPHGFREFLARETVSPDGPLPLYRLPELYDYLTAALGTAAFTGEDARRWALIAAALERIPGKAPPLAARVVKTVGLLAIYGEGVGLRANRDVLAAACDADSRDALDRAVAVLESASILLWRRHRDAFGLWEGSDISLDDAYEQARAERRAEPLHEKLLRVSAPRPLVARRHAVERGTLRHFEVRLSDRADAIDTAEAPTESDGVVIFLLDAEGDPAGVGAELTRPGAGKPVLAAATRMGSELMGAVEEVEAWQRVREATPALAGDPAALREVEAREEAARRRLETAVGAALGLLGHVLDPSRSRWFAGGAERPDITTPRELQRLLSDTFDAAYGEAPLLRNELLNRSRLSSAATAGRRNLVAAITEGPKERLGITGFPPEYSMFAALVEAGGFLHRSEDEWYFGEPGEDAWQPAWRAIRSFFEGAADSPRAVEDLGAVLAAPPIGLRAGPFPVLLALFLEVEGENAALYEEGVFVPEAGIEALERLMRRPETFAVRSFDLPADQTAVVTAVARALSLPADGRSGADLVRTARRLVSAAARLGPYGRHTRSISATARRVRDALLTARDPYDLVLRDLPEAVGSDLAEPGSGDDYADRLAAAVHECEGAFLALLDRIERALAEAFRVAPGPDLLASVDERAAALLPYAEPGLRRLLEAVRRMGGTRSDWRLGICLPLAKGLPPDRWTDEQAGGAERRLRLHGLEAQAIERLLPDADSGSTSTNGRLAHGSADDLRAHLTSAFDPTRFSLDEIRAALDAVLAQVVTTHPDAERPRAS